MSQLFQPISITDLIWSKTLISYTYLIGWSNLNRWYYGVRFAKNCNPTDLWQTYFTSSKQVKEFRKSNGEPDIIQVRKIFNDANKARLWEHNVIIKMNMVSDKRWLNLSDQTHKFYHEGPRGPFSEEHKKKLKIARKNRIISKEHIIKLHEGRRKSENSIEHNNAIRVARTGLKASDLTKDKQRISRQNISNLHELAVRAGKKAQEKRINNPIWTERYSTKMKEIWKLRKEGILPMPIRKSVGE